MLSFPTNLLTCCQLREAMETPRECRGVSERTPEFGGCILIFIKCHPSARKVLYEGGYFFLSFRRGGSFVSLCHTLCCFLSFFLPKKSSFSMCFTVIKYTWLSLASCLNRHSGIISDKEQRDTNADQCKAICNAGIHSAFHLHFYLSGATSERALHLVLEIIMATWLSDVSQSSFQESIQAVYH